MNSFKKPLLVAGVVGALGAGVVAGGTIAYAQSGERPGGDPMSGLVDKLASTFNLDRAKVQQVVDQQHAEMRAMHEQSVATRLQKLVDDKVITQAQKTAIEAKLAEMKKTHDEHRQNFKQMTGRDHKAAMDAMRTDLETWAKEQGLDLSKLRGIFPGGHHGHGRGSGEQM